MRIKEYQHSSIARRIACITPSISFITSLFQKRITLYPSDSRYCVLCASYSAASICWLPSSSMTNFLRGTQKSARYGPIACCFLNLMPCNCLLLRRDHSFNSAGVSSFRSSLARSYPLGVVLLDFMLLFYHSSCTPPAFGFLPKFFRNLGRWLRKETMG